MNIATVHYATQDLRTPGGALFTYSIQYRSQGFPCCGEIWGTVSAFNPPTLWYSHYHGGEIATVWTCGVCGATRTPEATVRRLQAPTRTTGTRSPDPTPHATDKP